MRLAALLSILLLVAPPALGQSRDQIAREIVDQSVSAYLRSTGNCPCPYNTKSNGHRCGGTSAYSRPGGASPICFVEDVTDAMIERYLTAR